MNQRYDYGMLYANLGVADGLAAYQYFDAMNFEWDHGVVGKFPYNFAPDAMIKNFKVLSLFYARRP